MKGQFTRIETYINTVRTEEIDEAHITLRLSYLGKLLNEYNDIQMEIEVLGGDEFEKKFTDREQMEGRYYNISSKASEILRNAGTAELVASNVTRTVTDDRSETGAELQVAIQTLIGHQATLADLIRNTSVSTCKKL